MIEVLVLDSPSRYSQPEIYLIVLLLLPPHLPLPLPVTPLLSTATTTTDRRRPPPPPSFQFEDEDGERSGCAVGCGWLRVYDMCCMLAGLACRIRHEDRILRREGLKLKAEVWPSPRDHSCARVHPFFSVCPSLRIRIGGKKGCLAKMAGRKRRELDGITKDYSKGSN